MSARVRRPTDDASTDVYDLSRHAAAPGSPAGYQSFEDDRTEETPMPVRSVPGLIETPTSIERATPTSIDPPPAPPAPAPRAVIRAERSEPIVVVSMKDQLAADRRGPAVHAVAPHVQLRSLAEVAGNHEAKELGRLAPPRDPREVRARRLRASLARAAVAILLAGAIGFATWWIAVHRGG